MVPEEYFGVIVEDEEDMWAERQGFQDIALGYDVHDNDNDNDNAGGRFSLQFGSRLFVSGGALLTAKYLNEMSSLPHDYMNLEHLIDQTIFLLTKQPNRGPHTYSSYTPS